MSTATAPTFSLKPVTTADIPALTELGRLTFEKDRHTQLKAAHPTDPYDHAGGIPESIQHLLSLPRRVQVTKAVDDVSGEILGFVGWASRGFDLDPTAPERIVDDASLGTSRQAPRKHLPKDSVSMDYVKDESSDLDALAQLKELTNSHFAAFQKKIMPEGSKCMFVAGINVHPKHQGKGIGQTLVRLGTDRADAEGVICWVHSSEAGAATFRKCGFEVDEVLEIDLDEWASKMDLAPPKGDEKWGKYTFRYFVRQPQIV